MAHQLGIDALHAFLAREFPQVAADFKVEALLPEGALVRLKVGPQHLRPGGTVSGPAMFTLADVGVYIALLSRLGEVALAVTTNTSIDFLRKPQAGCDLLAHVSLLKVGKTLAVADVHIRAEGAEAVVARASLTYAIPPAAAR